jgi:serine/threonine-protein kinase
VYSLGAVLYQLLTGRSPHAQPTGRAEAVEVIICTVEPQAPSRINAALSKDLDYILAKALRKEAEERFAGRPARRYDTDSKEGDPLRSNNSCETELPDDSNWSCFGTESVPFEELRAVS